MRSGGRLGRRAVVRLRCSGRKGRSEGVHGDMGMGRSGKGDVTGAGAGAGAEIVRGTEGVVSTADIGIGVAIGEVERSGGRGGSGAGVEITRVVIGIETMTTVQGVGTTRAAKDIGSTRVVRGVGEMGAGRGVGLGQGVAMDGALVRGGRIDKSTQGHCQLKDTVRMTIFEIPIHVSLSFSLALVPMMRLEVVGR